MRDYRISKKKLAELRRRLELREIRKKQIEQAEKTKKLIKKILVIGAGVILTAISAYYLWEVV